MAFQDVMRRRFEHVVEEATGRQVVGFRRAGLTEYVSGAGGSVRYGLRGDRRAAFARSDRTGALRMVLDVSGQVLDRSRASCRPAPS